ncbi:MAG: lauroyl acyltransferase [Alphaproteobacteria bacterium]|nr:MAG: lauroyl acyltransferase [Alphaproteobacteria bacterium]
MTLKQVRYLLEAVGLRLAIAGLGRLSPEAASNLGGFIGRTLGPHLGISRRARRNLRLAMPELGAAEIERIVRDMWDNLGRTAAEYPHLGRIAGPDSGYTQWVDADPVRALRDGGAAILASAHLANWEIMPVSAACYGIDMTIIVREPNNPLVRPMVERLRGAVGGARTPKGKAGTRVAVEVLGSGRVLGLLFDQKLNEGIPVPLFGVPAMTTTGPAQLAVRFGCPIIPVRIERTGPARFRITAHPPIQPPAGADRRAAVETLTRRLNEILEDWIRARPEQWLWLHNRWPKDAYRA